MRACSCTFTHTHTYVDRPLISCAQVLVYTHHTHTTHTTHTPHPMAGVFSVFVLLSLIVTLSEWVGARTLEAKRVAELNVSEHRGAQRAIGDNINGGGHQGGDFARSSDRYVAVLHVRGVAFTLYILLASASLYIHPHTSTHIHTLEHSTHIHTLEHSTNTPRTIHTPHNPTHIPSVRINSNFTWAPRSVLWGPNEDHDGSLRLRFVVGEYTATTSYYFLLLLASPARV